MEFHAVRVLGRKTKGVSNEAILNHLEDSRQNGVASLLGETCIQNHPQKSLHAKKLCQEMICLVPSKKMCNRSFLLLTQFYPHDILVLLEIRCFTITRSICDRALAMFIASLLSP